MQFSYKIKMQLSGLVKDSKVAGQMHVFLGDLGPIF